MAKPAGELEQWETRRGVTMRDQHGREYTAEMDIRTMGTVGPITPRNFRQPIPTPAQYLAPVKDQLGVVRIDYDKWKRDLMMAEGARITKLRGLAEKMYGNAFATVLKDPPGELLFKLGAGPLPVEFVMAMEAGKSPWALGLRRPNGQPYPKPSWVTKELEARMAAALNTVWSGFDSATELPVAAEGQFEDEPVEDEVMDVVEEVEEEIVDELPSLTVTGAGYGTVGRTQVVVPAKRGPGRPRKNA
jgi:hypothetical protein